jgi:hypothetical protein
MTADRAVSASSWTFPQFNTQNAPRIVGESVEIGAATIYDLKFPLGIDGCSSSKRAQRSWRHDEGARRHASRLDGAAREIPMSKKSETAVSETEDELVAKAQTAVSSCNWVVGECASKWTRKYAKGRTDGDFGALVGLSGDQTFQRRRVWETFGASRSQYPALKWSHFYVSLTWENSDQCLDWAQENEATVAEMRAWRRAVQGEDLTQDAPLDEWGTNPAVNQAPAQAREVRSLEAPLKAEAQPSAQLGRELKADSEYAPFRKDAGAPAPGEQPSDVAVAEKPRLSPSQIAERIIATLERINRDLSSDVVTQFRKLPAGLRNRFVTAVGELSSKAARLM